MKLIWTCLGILGLAVSSFAGAAPSQDFSRSTYIATKTRLWTEPTKFGEPLAELKPGLAVAILSYSTSAAWARVRTPGGREGWIPVRFTTLAGLREQPLVPRENNPTAGEIPPGGGDEISSKRRPSSVPSEGPEDPNSSDEKTETPPERIQPRGGSQGTARTSSRRQNQKTDDWFWTVTGQLSYVNELNLDTTSGGNAGVGIDLNSENFSFGVGLDYDFFYESASNSATDWNVTRSTNKLFPHLRASLILSQFSVLVGAGADIDFTNITTTNTASGTIVYTYNGGVVTGSDTNFAFRFKVAPTYRFELSPDTALGIQVMYYLIYDPSNGAGIFASAPSGNITSIIGGGLSFLYKF